MQVMYGKEFAGLGIINKQFPKNYKKLLVLCAHKSNLPI